MNKTTIGLAAVALLTASSTASALTGPMATKPRVQHHRSHRTRHRHRHNHNARRSAEGHLHTADPPFDEQRPTSRRYSPSPKRQS